MSDTEQITIVEAKGGQIKATCCRLPYRVNESESQLYRKILSLHCKHIQKKLTSHRCSGAATITKNAIVLRCKKCGDAKGNFDARPEVNR